MKVFLCAIAKCENLYIKEWVDWHLALGFDEIYIYDNNDLSGERIEDAVGGVEGVRIINIRGKKQSACEIQVAAYNGFIRDYSKNCNWFMFLDIDEFLNLKTFTNIKDYLAQDWVKEARAIRFFWKCYSDNNQLKWEEGKVRDRFTVPCENEKVNNYYKQIYRSRLSNFKMLNVHYSNRLYGVYYQNGKMVNGYIPITHDDGHVNHDCGWVDHYVTKSLEEYINIKLKRRNNGSSKKRLNKEFYFKYNDRTEEKERLLDEAYGEVKDRVEETPPAKTITTRKATHLNSPDIPSPTTYPFGVSICITAYKTADWVEECLDSVANQTWFKDNDNWEILLGVDACQETLEKVRSIMHKYKNLRVMMMERNVGTYVTSNTIMKEAKYRWLLRFDSDDVMLPNMINDIMQYAINNKFDILRPYAVDFGKSNGLLKDRHGCILIKKSIFEEFGGYKPWKCAADGELQTRLDKFVITQKYENIVFKRRIHDNNLTRRTDTGLHSKLRNEYKKQIITPNNKQQAIIKCETAAYKPVYNVIVSLTSYPKRFKYLTEVFNSILNNTIIPCKICLCLHENDTTKLSPQLKTFIAKNKIEILVNNDIDIKPHTKYFLTMKKYKNYPIITIDDDVVYSKDLIESLYNSYLLYPNAVSARRVHKIIYNDNGECKPYRSWSFNYTKCQSPNKQLFATGVGGVLYPPNILHIENFNIKEILECLYADDIFLKYKEQQFNIDTVWVKNSHIHGVKCLSNTDNDRLYVNNVLHNGNDEYLKKFKLYE